MNVTDRKCQAKLGQQDKRPRGSTGKEAATGIVTTSQLVRNSKKTCLTATGYFVSELLTPLSASFARMLAWAAARRAIGTR